MSPASEKNPNPDQRKPLPELFREAWSNALAAVSNAEDEAQKALSRVWAPDEVRKHAREFADRLAGQRRDVEKSIDTGVKRALSRAKLPKREEVEALRQRTAELSARVDALLQKRGGSR